MCLSDHREFRNSTLEAVMPGRERRGQIRNRSRTGPDDTVSRNFPKTNLLVSHADRWRTCQDR